eukprot:bmy_06824T0
MARRSAFPAAALRVWSILPCLLVLRAEVGQPREESLYLWIDAHQARVLIGFEEDILIVSEGKMAPFTHDFRRAQQRMPAIPVNIHSMNFTWQAEGQAEYFYEFLSLRSLDKGIMADPTVNVPLLGTVPHKASGYPFTNDKFTIKADNSIQLFPTRLPPVSSQSARLFGEDTIQINCFSIPSFSLVVQVGFPCLGKQDGVAAFEVNVIVMNSEGNTILQTPQNAIFFKTCQQAECPGGCRNGGFCNERRVCQCPDGFYGPHCEKGYGASLTHALRPAGTGLRQHTPSLKKAEERQDPPESNYIW